MNDWIQVAIEKSVYDRLKEYADNHGQKYNYLLTQIVKEHLNKHENKESK